MQVILGAGGAIAKSLAKELSTFTNNIRLVSRNPERVNESDHLMQADLLKLKDMKQAIKGAEIVYLTIGFEYRLKVWKRNWPLLMNNLIEACSQEKCKVVFFDNIYMYEGKDLSNITEASLLNPPSKKGLIRKQIAQQLMAASKSKDFPVLIARSADFYGPGIEKVSVLTESVFNPLSKGKKAQWLGSLDKSHSFTYVSDAAKATALLGNTDSAFGEVWHLPTAKHPPSGRNWIEMIAKGLNVKPTMQVAPKWMVNILALFSPLMKELKEMLYQYDRVYVFNSDKIELRFGIKPTSYQDGVRQIIEQDYKNSSI